VGVPLNHPKRVFLLLKHLGWDIQPKRLWVIREGKGGSENHRGESMPGMEKTRRKIIKKIES